MPLPRTLTRAAGFTLVELIVTMVLAGIILAIAVPYMLKIVQQNRVATQANEFVGDLNYTRSEAITRGTRVTMCKSATGQQCTTSGGWEQGWIVFVDSVNQNATVDNKEKILRVRQALDGGATLTGPDYISYIGTGFSENVDKTFVNDTFTATVGSEVRDIIVNMVGRVRTKNPNK